MPKSYANNAYNRSVGRVGMPMGSCVISRGSSGGGGGGGGSSSRSSGGSYGGYSSGYTASPVSYGSSTGGSSSTKSYVDNAYNRSVGRVGMPVGSCVISKGSSAGGGDSGFLSGYSSASASSDRTYVDNASNRRLGRVGEPMYEGFNLWHKLHFCLAQAKFLSITGNISKSTEYVKEIEALITEIDCKDYQAMMRGCLERFKQTLHAEDQRKAGQTEDEVATSIGDSLNIGLVAHESFEKDHDLSVWPFLLEDVMLKADTYTETAKRNNFLIQNVVICPSAVARENIMQIPELLKTGGLIPRLIIQHAIQLALQTKDRKKAHELLLSVARYIKQADADNIADAWPAYKENKPWDPIFVVLTISNFQGEWEEILGFPVFKRRYDFVSSEAAIVVNSKKVAENLLDYSDFNKLKNVTHSREVIEKHSNITIMNACSFRSKSGGKEIYKETCVVIHCLVKGLIPFQEEPFPRNISGIPVDVREGYVTMGMKPGESGGQYVDVDRMSPEGAVSQDVDCEIVDHVQSPKYKAEYHSMCEKMQNIDLVGPCVQTGTRSTDVNQNLLMGTTISRTGSIPLTGTLGGFVRLHGGDMGFVTCAHVVGLTKDQTVSQPSHAELPPSHRSPGTICGHVEHAIFAPGHCDETGIDAAVVRISKRQPTDGEFIWVSPESQAAAGFPSTLKFTSGKVLTRAELKENRRTDVIKVGSQSGLTRGSLYLTESFIRINNREMILPGGETVEFYNQMEIQSHAGSKAFFELGDSGSLVFMALKNNELHCIGLAIGKTSYSSCLITPISDVLHRLGLQDQLLQFGVLHGPPSNGFHLPNGRL